MKLNLALPLVLAIMLSGCSETTVAGPAHTTVATKTTAQVTSAVAKTRPQLEAAMDQFDAGDCRVSMEKDGNGEGGIDCVTALTDMAAQARLMRKDLEDAKPWSEETQALADETLYRLENMAEAANYGDGKSMTVTVSTMEFMRTQLQAWKPFGA